MKILLKLNLEFFRVIGTLTFILYLLETLKDGYVSFFLNPVFFVLAFLVSGVVWLFTPDFDNI
jgi:hypothetical protein